MFRQIELYECIVNHLFSQLIRKTLKILIMIDTSLVKIIYL